MRRKIYAMVYGFAILAMLTFCYTPLMTQASASHYYEKGGTGWFGKHAYDADPEIIGSGSDFDVVFSDDMTWDGNEGAVGGAGQYFYMKEVDTSMGTIRSVESRDYKTIEKDNDHNAYVLTFDWTVDHNELRDKEQGHKQGNTYYFRDTFHFKCHMERKLFGVTVGEKGPWQGTYVCEHTYTSSA